MAAGSNGASSCGGEQMQAANTTTDATGAFSVTFATAFATSVPVVNVIPMNSGSQPIVCNVLTRSATTVTGKCFQAATATVSILGFLVNVFANGSANGTAVLVFGEDATQ